VVDNGKRSRRTRHELDVVPIIASVIGANGEVEGLSLAVDEAGQGLVMEHERIEVSKITWLDSLQLLLQRFLASAP